MIDVNAFCAPHDQRKILLHELAHFVRRRTDPTGEGGHDAGFWAIAWRLYERYGPPLPVSFAFDCHSPGSVPGYLAHCFARAGTADTADTARPSDRRNPLGAHVTWIFKLDFLAELALKEWQMDRKERDQLERLALGIGEVFQQAPDLTFDGLLTALWREILAARYPRTDRELDAAERVGSTPSHRRDLSMKEAVAEVERLVHLGTSPWADRDYKLVGKFLEDGSFARLPMSLRWFFANGEDRLMALTIFLVQHVLQTVPKADADGALDARRAARDQFLKILDHIVAGEQQVDSTPGQRTTGVPSA